MRNRARDPHIKKHSVKKLREYSEAFRVYAVKQREVADYFDAKAKRYEARARKLEREEADEQR